MELSLDFFWIRDGDGMDQVPFTFVSLDLAGGQFGGFSVFAGLDLDVVSVGEVEETVNNLPGVLEVSPENPGTSTYGLNLQILFDMALSIPCSLDHDLRFWV